MGGETSSHKANAHFKRQQEANTASGKTRGRDDIVKSEQVR